MILVMMIDDVCVCVCERERGGGLLEDYSQRNASWSI